MHEWNKFSAVISSDSINFNDLLNYVENIGNNYV